MKLSVIIVNYNVQFFLENCLYSVINAAKGIDCEIIVVDNNSVDKSVEMLKSKFPSVTCISNAENLGFSKANNQAIKMAKGELILLLNPDTVVEENTFKTCIEQFDKNSRIGGLGVKMLDGKGNFLPESKRGLPTPSVAFYKIFGLSSLFPRSKKFGKYHLGYLSKDENHEIEILSGAFMMLRSSVLKEIGLLDEKFFMYGEDIDLSYRITEAGYINYYLAETSIIHYKGESTKKSSINYVFVFYRAMVIFAKKHFSNKNAQLFSTFINLAIYLRASMAVFTRTIKNFITPIIDGNLLFWGIYFFKEYYEQKVKFVSGGSYPEEVETYGIPIMVFIYLMSSYFNGSFAIPTRFINTVKGVFSGSLLVLIAYALLDESFRFSRAIILFSVLWAIFIVPAFRIILNATGIIRFRKNKSQRIAIIGKKDELERITTFLKDTLIEPELISYINSDENEDGYNYSGKLYQLQDIIEIYKINEIIFCSKDLSSKEIIQQMASINSQVIDFKIAPPESLYIIGSNSIESSGEYYLIGSNVVLKPINQRNKRILDITLSFLLLITFPLIALFFKSPFQYLKNLFAVLFGKISFVGLINNPEVINKNLKIKEGIFNPRDLLLTDTDQKNLERLNLEYVRNYSLFKDLEIIFKSFNHLDRKN